MSTPTTTIAVSTTTASSSATTSCVSAVPGKNGYVPPSACNAVYDYNPSFAAAIIFAVTFGILTGVHLIQAVSYRRVSSLSGLLYENCDDTDNTECGIIEVLLGHYHGWILGDLFLCLAHFGHKKSTECYLCHRIANSTATSTTLYVFRYFF